MSITFRFIISRSKVEYLWRVRRAIRKKASELEALARDWCNSLFLIGVEFAINPVVWAKLIISVERRIPSDSFLI